MGQGKRLRRGARQKVDWRETVATDFAVWRLRRQGRAVLDPVTPAEREEIRRQADELDLKQFDQRKQERDAVWLQWHRSEDPDKALTWRAHCTAIRREDLIRNECISRLGVFDSDYIDENRCFISK